MEVQDLSPEVAALVPSRGSNRIVVKMNGEPRTIVAGLEAFQMVCDRMRNDSISLTNSAEVMLEMVQLGMRDKPEDLSRKTLIEWIDDMENNERDALQFFISYSLGFIIADYANSVEAILPRLMGNS